MLNSRFAGAKAVQGRAPYWGVGGLYCPLFFHKSTSDDWIDDGAEIAVSAVAHPPVN
jgi:hypothetical protein